MALPEGYSFENAGGGGRMYSSVMPQFGMKYAYGPDGKRIEVPDPAVSDEERNARGPLVPYGQVPAQNLNPGNDIEGVQPLNPVLQGIDRNEIISDPALRELYFGSSDTPGLINQATQAAQKSFLDQPAILQGTAGLSAQEQQARQLAQSGIGSYQPFLNRQENLIGQGISDLGQQRGLLGEALGGYRSAYGAQQPYLNQAEQRFGSAYGAQQPYFGQAEQQLGSGLGGMFNSLGSSRNLLGQSLQGYNPGMANQFYNPFENQVVNQTIEDVMKAGDIQDIQQRASDISQGGESAFGSRARLTADERRASLGRGLGEALGQIRSGGFNTAQDRALNELQNRRSGASSAAQLEAGFGAQGSDAQRQYAQDLMGIGQNRSAAERQYGQDLLGMGDTRGGLQRQLAGDITGVGTGIAGIGANLAGYGSQLGDLGATQQRLRGADIGMLEGLGSVNRGIDQQRLNNQYNQEYATRMAPTQAASYIQGFAPQYQGSTTQVNKLYGMPVDPRNAAIAAGIGTYNSLKQPNTEYQPSLTDRAEADYWAAKQKDIQDRQRTYTPPSDANAGGASSADPYRDPYAPPVPGTGTSFASNPLKYLTNSPQPQYQPQQPQQPQPPQYQPAPNPYTPPPPSYQPPPNPYQPRPPQGGGYNGGYI